MAQKQVIETEIDTETGAVGRTTAGFTEDGEDTIVRQAPQKKAVEDEIEIEIVDDTPPADKGKTPAAGKIVSAETTDEDLAQYDETVRNRINRMRFEFHDMRRQKEASERERDEAIQHAQRVMQEASQLRSLVGESENALVASAKGKAAAELEAAKREYREAFDKGDVDAMMAAQDKSTKALVQLQRFEGYRPRQAAQATQQPPQGQQQAFQGGGSVNGQGQPGGQPMGQPPAITREERQWLDENPWFMKNNEMTSFAYGVEADLRKQGIRQGSPEYLNAISRRVREVFPKSEYFQPEPKKQTTVVASASRSAPGTAKTVRLSESQVRVARRLGLTPEQYARQVMKEQSGG